MNTVAVQDILDIADLLIAQVKHGCVPDFSQIEVIDVFTFECGDLLVQIGRYFVSECG